VAPVSKSTDPASTLQSLHEKGRKIETSTPIPDKLDVLELLEECLQFVQVIAFVGSRETSLKRVFSHSQESLSGMEHVSIEVRTGGESLTTRSGLTPTFDDSQPSYCASHCLEYCLSLGGPLSYSRWIRLELPAAQSWLSFRHDGGKGGRWKRKEGEDVGKARVAGQTAGTTEWASTPSSIYKGETKRLCRRALKNSVKKGSPLWDPSKCARATRRSPCAHHGSPGSPCLRGAII
jgi:hypothetical protein